MRDPEVRPLFFFSCEDISDFNASSLRRINRTCKIELRLNNKYYIVRPDSFCFFQKDKRRSVPCSINLYFFLPPSYRYLSPCQKRQTITTYKIESYCTTRQIRLSLKGTSSALFGGGITFLSGKICMLSDIADVQGSCTLTRSMDSRFRMALN